MTDAAPATPGAFVLVVTQTFGSYKIGDVISDPAEIAKIIDTHHESFVVKRAA